MYNHPLGTHEWDWISNWQGVYDGWGIFALQQHWYETLGGRYTSNLLLSLTDDWYQLNWFRGVFVGNLLLLLMASVFLFKQAFPFVSSYTLAILAGLNLALYLATASSIYEDIYRFTVVVIYQMGLTGNMLFAALLIRLQQKGELTKWLIGLLFLLSSLTIGMNEVSLALILLTLGVFLLVYYLNGTCPPVYIWVLLLWSIFWVWLCVTSPGNTVRAEVTGVTRQVSKSILVTIGASGYLGLRWLGGSLLIPVSLMLIPIMVKYREAFAQSVIFGRPWLWGCVLVGLLPAIWLPIFYSSGLTLFPEYIVDMLYFIFQLCFWGTIISIFLQYELSWIGRIQALPVWGTLLGVYCVVRLFIGDIELNKSDRDSSVSHWSRIELSSNIGKAWYSLLSGNARQYAREVSYQYEQITKCQETICKVYQPTIQPPFLYDPVYDRRDDVGDPFLCWFFQGRECVIKYNNAEN